jgi:hypothetical protein
MTQEPKPLADHDTATMSGKVYNQLRAAWERDRAAAAPQMLEALIDAREALRGLENRRATLRIVEAAIARARGNV